MKPTHTPDALTHDGLAVLSAPGLFRVFLLQNPVPELAVAADSFHTKPLRHWLQSVGRYQVLALSLHKVQLFEGDRNARTEPHSTVSSYGGIGGDHIDGTEALERVSAHISRVEVHLSDENGGKNGQHDLREKTSGLPLSGTDPANWSDSPVA